MLNHIVLRQAHKRPELRRTPRTAAASFTGLIETSPPRSGEKETDLLTSCMEAYAEFVSKYFSKGQMAAVSGRLQIRDWTDKDGGKRRNAEVVAENVYFADSKKLQIHGEYQELDDDDSDLPF